MLWTMGVLQGTVQLIPCPRNTVLVVNVLIVSLPLPDVEQQPTHRNLTIVVLADICGTFESLDRTVILGCLLKKSVLEKFINILKAPSANTLGKVKAYNHFSPLLHSVNRVPKSLFNFTFWKQLWWKWVMVM